MIKYRMIFIYYVLNEITEIHKLHLNLLNMLGKKFNNIDLILNIDDINNTELIERTKNEILNITQLNNINFIINQNDKELREGLAYKKYLIDRLDQFEDNELVFFGHTKGLTGELDTNPENIENTKHWIKLMYFENLDNFVHVDHNLIEEDNVCYGSIYCYDPSNPVKYHWQYTGSFYWIHPKRLLKVLNDNNFNYDLYTKQQCRNIAEEILGNNVDTDKAAFMNHEQFNKKYSVILYNNHATPYFNIRWIAFNFLTIENFINYNDFCNEFYNKFES